MWRHNVKCPKTLLTTTALASLLTFCIIGGYVHIGRLSACVAPSDDLVKDKRTCRQNTVTQCHSYISMTRDTRYILYGEGLADQQTTKRLHSYIRSLTSRQTPGGVRLTDKSGQQHFSQIGESQFVDKLLKGRRNGVFIECGAADGEQLSNSLFFELHRNWTGILIEGNPQFYEPLLAKNRNAYVVRACLSTTSKPQIVKYMLAHFGSGIYNKMHSSVVKDFHLENKPTIDIHCFPLNSITAALGIQQVDYLSLDVEGPEVDILSTIDWTQLSVDVMTLEYGKKPYKLKQLRSLLTANGTFTEVALLPVGSNDNTGMDVVFMRTGVHPDG